MQPMEYTWQNEGSGNLISKNHAQNLLPSSMIINMLAFYYKQKY
jgi:hypothetical protein